MEPITCVIDATTLIEHIHEIKSWTYDGYLKLVVPLCTVERIEQIYKMKKEELEVKALDPPKKRLSWKNVRKEHPAFDINTQVALEFVKRTEVEESKTMVEFQKPSEEYSPWKGVEVQQEKKEVKEERPSTFAQALAKSNTANGLSSVAGAPKGPVKPKLVARASGAETSPWKMNKKAPKVPPKEVPEALRPLLSYTLWRIYENVVTWSDTNPTVLLSSDPKTSAMAYKLNIIVKQIGQLRQVIADKKINETDHSISGNLERDFGFPVSRTSPLEIEKIHEDLEDLVSEAKADNELDALVVSDKQLNGGHGALEQTEDALVNGGQNGNLAVDQNEQKNVHEVAVEASVNPNYNILEEFKGVPDKSESTIPEDELGVDLVTKATEIDAKENLVSGPAAEADPNLVIKLSDKSEGTSNKIDLATHSVRVPLEKHRSLLYTEAAQPDLSSRASTINGSSSTSRGSSRESSSLPTQVTQEPEDSDEEVVVFNPRARRFSTQHKISPKPAPNVSKSPRTAVVKIPATAASTATVTAPATPPATPPETSPAIAPAIVPAIVSTAAPVIAPAIAPAIAPTTATSPKLASVNEISPKLSSVRINSYRHASAKTNAAKSNHGKNLRPQPPAVPAAVIDPDFFGRSSVVNVRPSIQNGNSRNSPRGSPRRGPRIPDPDVDYVLTSGATREAARGRGKLWIP